MTEYQFELQEGFTYAHDGGEATAKFITIHPPTSRHLKECADLKQFVFRSLPKPTGDGEKEEDDGKDDPGVLSRTDILGLLYTSQTVSLATVLVTGRTLLSSKNSVAFADGEERMTIPMLDKMCPVDFENLVGEYIARFIIASALAQLKSK